MDKRFHYNHFEILKYFNCSRVYLMTWSHSYLALCAVQAPEIENIQHAMFIMCNQFQ